MNSAVSDQVFSVPFRHLWSTNFSGDMTASLGPANGLTRFVGDRANLMLRYFTTDHLRENLGNQSSKVAWPLVLFGPSGTGKTSLAMSILSDLFDQQPANSTSKPIFLSATDFDRRYRQSLETDSLDDFRDRFYQSAGIVIDDLHRLAKKTAVQKELVVILDLLARKNLPFIATMNISPLLCEQFCPQLSSRLSGGLNLPVHPPGPSAREEIIAELATANQVTMTPDAIGLIVDRLEVTVPKLNHFFAQIKSAIRAEGTIDLQTPIDAALLTRLFKKDSLDVHQMANLIVKKVAAEFHLKVSDLKSNSRKQSIVLARGVAIFLNRTLLGSSFLKIGTHFGNRDHSTVLHAYRKIENILASDDTVDAPTIRQSVSKLKQQLSEQFASQINFV